jgi:hypothetical protein
MKFHKKRVHIALLFLVLVAFLYIFLCCHNQRYPVIEDQVAVSGSKLVATLVLSLM